jgi:hypothetical protein
MVKNKVQYIERYSKVSKRKVVAKVADQPDVTLRTRLKTSFLNSKTLLFEASSFECILRVRKLEDVRCQYAANSHTL